MSMENTILANLIHNEEYYRKVFPYIKEEYFDDNAIKKIFNSFSEYVSEYQGLPSIEALKITLEDRKDLNENTFKEVVEKIGELKTDSKTDPEWLLDQTEKFCQDKDLYNSIRKSIMIYDGQDKEYDKGAIPELLSKSLAISFDTHIGHDFLEDFNSRYEYYHRKEERIPFDIDIMNMITKGGLPKKSLTLFLGATGSGKSIVKCHMAAAHLLFGKNVLYITAELSEEEVGRRIDANMMEITIDEVADLPLSTYEKRMSRLKDKTPGKLIIKEYPTSSAHVGHFRHLLNELRMKKNFKPDVIYLDYLNICASSRLKGNSAANSYTLVKSIAEEVRGLAVEFNVPIVSSSQLNRDGYNNSDVDLTNTSECIFVDEKVTEKTKGVMRIADLSPGDIIKSNDGTKIVTMVHHPKSKECVKITTKSGKEIIVSKNHVFPAKSPTGEVKRISVSGGLEKGFYINGINGECNTHTGDTNDKEFNRKKTS
jgi:archaellum biogenesis ATPase FlaH